MGRLAASGRGLSAPSAREGCSAPAGGRARTREQTRPLNVAVDASTLLDAALGPARGAFRRLLARLEVRSARLIAPELLWSESYSVLHELAWRGRLDAEDVEEALGLVRSAPIGLRRPRELRERAWQIADRMGWAKTYDAEYCALAELLGCPLVTTDRRLRADAARLGYVQTPDEAAEDE